VPTKQENGELFIRKKSLTYDYAGDRENGKKTCWTAEILISQNTGYVGEFAGEPRRWSLEGIKGLASKSSEGEGGSVGRNKLSLGYN